MRPVINLKKLNEWVEPQHFKMKDMGWDTQRTTEGERLDGEGRPQRCILYNPNTHRPPTLTEAHSGAGTLSIHMPPIRPVVGPIGIQ